MQNDELIMYFIVNKELNMSPGKIATQVAHTLTHYLNYIKNIHSVEVANKGFYKEEDQESKDLRNYYHWYNGSQKKIILKAKQPTLEKLEEDYWNTRDLGLTEVEENSLTCVCLGIKTREDAKPIVKRLQLL